MSKSPYYLVLKAGVTLVDVLHIGTNFKECRKLAMKWARMESDNWHQIGVYEYNPVINYSEKSIKPGVGSRHKPIVAYTMSGHNYCRRVEPAEIGY